MFKSRKFTIWFITLLVFVLLVLLMLFLKREELYIAELGFALTGISGVYYGGNVYRHKYQNPNSWESQNQNHNLPTNQNHDIKFPRTNS